MNKQELLKLLSTLELDKEDFYVVSSGALVLRGLFPDAGDLDIVVTEKGLEKLKQQHDLKQKENGWYTVTDKIECICDWKKEEKNNKPELVENYYVQNLQEYYEFLLQSTREKDKLRIELVKNALEK